MVGVAHGQASNGAKFKVTAEKPEFDELLSPDFGGKKGFRPKEWLEVEAKLMVQMAPEPKSKTCDRITVKWYVAVANPEKRGTFLLFSQDVDYVNVPVGEEFYCSIYMSPASIRRILGAARNPKRAVEVVGYEVQINGKPYAAETSNPKYKVPWWTMSSKSLIKSDVVPLLNKSKTPFANMWWDRYAEVAPEQSSSKP